MKSIFILCVIGLSQLNFADTIMLKNHVTMNGHVTFDGVVLVLNARYKDGTRTITIPKDQLLNITFNSQDFNNTPAPPRITGSYLGSDGSVVVAYIPKDVKDTSAHIVIDIGNSGDLVLKYGPYEDPIPTDLLSVTMPSAQPKKDLQLTDLQPGRRYRWEVLENDRVLDNGEFSTSFTNGSVGFSIDDLDVKALGTTEAALECKPRTIIRFGTSPGTLDRSVPCESIGGTFEAVLLGLLPSTKYYFVSASANGHGKNTGFFRTKTPDALTLPAIEDLVILARGESKSGSLRKITETEVELKLQGGVYLKSKRVSVQEIIFSH